MDLTTGKPLVDLAVGHSSHLQPKPVTRSMPFNLAEISKLPLALSVLSHVDRGDLDLSATLKELWPAAVGLHQVTLEHILSHTTGFNHVVPPGVDELRKLCDLDAMLRHLERPDMELLLAAGEKQVYHHFTFGWLLTGILRGLGRDLKQSVSAVSPGISLSRTAVCFDLNERSTAEVQESMTSASIEDMAEKFALLADAIEVCETYKSPKATAEDKMRYKVFMGLMGKVHWLQVPTWQEPVWTSGSLPGAVSYATAHTMAELLCRTAQGKVVKKSTLQNMRRSRRVPGKPTTLPYAFQPFTESEWGLGVELVKLPGRPDGEKAWGHTSAGGSFVLAIEGARPVAVAWLQNLSTGWKDGTSHAILSAVADFAAGKGPAVR